MSATLTPVLLYGELGRLFGRKHWFYLDSNTTAEAIRALVANFPKLEAYLMQAKDRGIGFSIFRGKQNLSEGELTSATIEGDIRIAPMIMGSKKAGTFQIILGIVLVVVGVVIDFFTEGTGGNQLIYAGIAMVAGGVVELLTATPKKLNNKDAGANQASYTFSGAVNTQAQGNPVPVLYGEMIVGSAVISAGIQAEDTVATQGATSGSHGGMGGGGKLINRVPI